MSLARPVEDMTPAGLQGAAALRRRRLVAIALNLMTYFALLWWLGAILGDQGWSVVDVAIFACFAMAAPWSVLGVWNALIGLGLLHIRDDARQLVMPFATAADAADPTDPITARTAILMTLRNEDPARALARLETVVLSLAQAGDDAS